MTSYGDFKKCKSSAAFFWNYCKFEMFFYIAKLFLDPRMHAIWHFIALQYPLNYSVIFYREAHYSKDISNRHKNKMKAALNWKTTALARTVVFMQHKIITGLSYKLALYAPENRFYVLFFWQAFFDYAYTVSRDVMWHAIFWAKSDIISFYIESD